MKCKTCGKVDFEKIFGLRDFCSPECKDEFRRNYLRLKAQERRNNEKMKVSTDPSKIYKSNPYKSRVPEVSNSMSVNFFDDFGGKDWCSLSKRDCCNFDVRLNEGYCITLAEPYYLYICKCNVCPLGRGLMNKAKGTLQRAA